MENADFKLHCPIPISEYPNILLAHGSGGKLTHQLIEKMFSPAFQNPYLNQHHDGAVIDIGKFTNAKRIAFTTDSYVINPIHFPGGDIGVLSVNGTVNDLAMCGARPLWMSLGFIIEEGFEMDKLWQIVQSVKRATQEQSIQCVTGDTKVVDRGKGDGLYINTSGIGVVEHDLEIAPSAVKKGDAILINGDIGRHGMAVMAVREGLAFESQIRSDCAPLVSLVLDLLRTGIRVHCLRDLTRGGLGNALVEVAQSRRASFDISEEAILVHEDVRSACEILGLEPLYVANEGRLMVFLPSEDVEKALCIMRSHPLGEGASLVGSVREVDCEAHVSMKTAIGTKRMIDMLSGEQLPRIC